MHREFDCDGVVSEGRAVVTVCSSYTQPVLGAARVLMGGYILPQGSGLDHELTALHDSLVAALGRCSGVTHMEALQADRGLLVDEIACRPGGAGVSREALLARGIDIWAAFYTDSLVSLSHIPAAAGFSGRNNQSSSRARRFCLRTRHHDLLVARGCGSGQGRWFRT